MKPDWRELTDDEDTDDEGLWIDVGAGRLHGVWVEDQEDGWKVSGFVADENTLRKSGIDPVELWRRNRSLNLVGYSVDEQGSAWVVAWLPYAGTTAHEFQEVARHVAVEADRLEFYLTGKDVH